MIGLVFDYLQRLYRGTQSGWNRFWFTGTDPATLGLIRILTGWMLVYTHLVWTKGLDRFLGPDAMLPPDYVREFHGSSWAWSYLFWIDSPALLAVVHGLALIVFVAFMIGFQTRWTGILSFLITVAYINRTVHGLFGLDQINGFLALYLAIGPSGAAYSLDRWLARRRQGQTLTIQKSIGANVSIRLIQLHMCVVYLFAALGKLQGETWWTGEALWGAFANYEYQTLDMTWTAHYPMLVDFLTHVTVFWEISYCVLVWPKLTRPLVIMMAVPLHLGIAFGMGMITFGCIMLIANLAFVSPWLTRRVIEGGLLRKPLDALPSSETGERLRQAPS